jgi:hypothetical protein
MTARHGLDIGVDVDVDVPRFARCGQKSEPCESPSDRAARTRGLRPRFVRATQSRRSSGRCGPSDDGECLRDKPAPFGVYSVQSHRKGSRMRARTRTTRKTRKDAKEALRMCGRSAGGLLELMMAAVVESRALRGRVAGWSLAMSPQRGMGVRATTVGAGELAARALCGRTAGRAVTLSCGFCPSAGERAATDDSQCVEAETDETAHSAGVISAHVRLHASPQAAKINFARSREPTLAASASGAANSQGGVIIKASRQESKQIKAVKAGGKAGRSKPADRRNQR